MMSAKNKTRLIASYKKCFQYFYPSPDCFALFFCSSPSTQHHQNCISYHKCVFIIKGKEDNTKKEPKRHKADILRLPFFHSLSTDSSAWVWVGVGGEDKQQQQR